MTTTEQDYQLHLELNRVRQIMDRIPYRRDYRWRVEASGGRVFLQIEHWRPDVGTGEMAWGPGGKRFLSKWMTTSEIVRAAFAAALAYEEHEVREFFKYRGVAVFGPHIDVEALVEVADRLDVRP